MQPHIEWTNGQLRFIDRIRRFYWIISIRAIRFWHTSKSKRKRNSNESILNRDKTDVDQLCMRRFECFIQLMWLILMSLSLSLSIIHISYEPVYGNLSFEWIRRIFLIWVAHELDSESLICKLIRLTIETERWKSGNVHYKRLKI